MANPANNNTFEAYTPEYWSNRMQTIRHKKTVYAKVGNMEERSKLSDGDTVNRPLATSPFVTDYVNGTDVETQDLEGTEEKLVVNQQKTAPFYIDDVEEMQSSYKLNDKFAGEAGKRLEEFIDGDFLAETLNADWTIDSGDLSGSGTDPAVISPSNIIKVFTSAQKYLNRANIDMANRYGVISPTGLQVLLEKLEGRDTDLGDEIAEDGMVGRYMGFELYVSNNLYFTATWTPADNPSDGDTVTINGVTFTFESGTIDNSGEVNIGGNLGATLDNLAAAINGTGTEGTDYGTRDDDLKKQLVGFSATNDSDTALDLVGQGGGEVQVSASETNDTWGSHVVNWMFGLKGAVDIVIQKKPDIIRRPHPYRRGENTIPLTVYGIKTFSEGAEAMVRAKIDASTF